MIIDFTFFVTPSTLTIKVPSVNFDYQAPNVVAYDTESLKILAIGESETDIQEQTGPKWEEIKHKIGFTATFGIDDKYQDLDFMVIDYYLILAHLKVRNTNIPTLFARYYIDRYDCNIWIDGYERFPVERRQKYEYYLQSFHKVRKLIINGHEVQIPDRMRIFEQIFRSSISIFPYLMMLLGLFWGAEHVSGNYLIPYLISLLFIIIIMAFIGILAWMLVMRRYLPRSYLRYVVLELALAKITKNLSKRFLAD